MARPTSKPKKVDRRLANAQLAQPFLNLSNDVQLHATSGPKLIDPNAQGVGSRMGEVLAFVRGLRLSARLIYILRDKLSDYDVDINWGHVQNDHRSVCSSECDIIIHSGGKADRWNGSDQHTGSVMDFWFVRHTQVHAVISCKSQVEAIDERFAKNLKKEFGVKNVLIFAESIKKGAKARLTAKAVKCGYLGFWYLYEVSKGVKDSPKDDYARFVKKLKSILPLKPNRR